MHPLQIAREQYARATGAIAALNKLEVSLLEARILAPDVLEHICFNRDESRDEQNAARGEIHRLVIECGETA